MKNVTQERLRDALLDACPDAEPAMVLNIAKHIIEECDL